MQKILVATDFSEESLALINYIEDFSFCGVKSIVVVHVLEEEQSEKEKENERLALDRLEDIRVYLEGKGFQASISLLWGDPATEIKTSAGINNVDLIVIASQGRKYIRRALLGSTTLELLQISSVAVIIEKGNLIKEKDSISAHFRKVMIPTDFSLSSLAALDFVKGMRTYINEVIFVHIVEGRMSEEKYIIEKASAALKLAELTDELEDFGIKASYHIGHGAMASKEVIEFSEEINASMIVLPKIKGGLVANILKGDTAQAIALGADIPVMMVPSDDD